MSNAPENMRLETPAENIARDMEEGRFPRSSPPKLVPATDEETDTPDVWDRILADPELADARAKLSIHELRLLIQHAEAAFRPSHTPWEEFAAWIVQGPKLAAAAGCYVGIKVTEATASMKKAG